MDCNEFNEKIDIFVDDALDEADKQLLLRHASSCPACGKALDEALCLKHALGNMVEVEPPEGLAASAVKKARRRRIPIYAYASVAAAVVITLLVVLVQQMAPQTGTANDVALEQKMYAAADTAQEEPEAEAGVMESAVAMESANAMDSTVAGEGEIQSTQEPGIKGSSEAASDDMVAMCAPCEVFTSEAALNEALQQETTGQTRGVTVYYRPSALPEGAQLVQIELTGDLLRWIYSVRDDSAETLVYEWYLVWTPEDIQGWSEEVALRSDNLAHSFRYGGDYFWSEQARFNESGEMEATDGTVINVYWAQNGAAFHAQLPDSLEGQDVLAYCEMEQGMPG